MEDHLLKILFLASYPGDAARQRVEAELGEIKEKLKSKDKFDLVASEGSVRSRDVLQAIFDHKPDIIHFVGHKEETEELYLENEQGSAYPVQPETLSRLFELVTEYVKCVVMNTCYSEAQAEAIAKHIPFVVGVQQAIGDQAALEFTSGFYTALEAEPLIWENHQAIEKIKRAFGLGRVAIQFDSTQLEHLNPVLIFGDTRNRFRVEVNKVRAQLEKPDSTSATIYREALLEKGKGMKLSPQEAESVINEVFEQIKEKQRKKQKYEQEFRRAIREEFPVEEEVREALQFLKAGLGLSDEDVAAIEKSVTSDPYWQTPETFFDRGTIQYSLGEHQKAIKYYTKAIELRPTYSSAYFDRGRAYFGLAIKENHKENMEAAINDWQETLKYRPNYSLAYYNIALAYEEVGNQVEALKNYTQAAEINGDWGTITLAHAYYKRMLIEQDMGNDQAADEDFQKAADFLRANPDNQSLFSPNVLDYLGLTLETKAKAES